MARIALYSQISMTPKWENAVSLPLERHARQKPLCKGCGVADVKKEIFQCLGAFYLIYLLTGFSADLNREALAMKATLT
jgi:hypothetical protein